ncbi:MAG TPA: glutathione S-transferase [Polyangiaceae bacterium]|jgi:glutathione S-transferase|nr:glutathione S-transferase [Polyangiaceae bacterium]
MSDDRETSDLVLFGRSSSSFTRIARIYAAELGLSYEFRVVPDLMSLEAADYGGNPALRMPVLHTAEGAWFGSASICRAFARRASSERRLVWPEDLERPLGANAQELVLVALSTEVNLIMAQLAGAGVGGNIDKLRRSLESTLTWLDEHIDSVVASLPSERLVSFLEVTGFCLVTHLSFRDVLPITRYPRLVAFSERFAERASARETAYRFDR